MDSLSLRRRVLTRALRLELGRLGLGWELAIPIMDTAIIPTDTIDRTPTIDHITIMVGRHTTGITGIESTATIVIITTVIDTTKLT